MSSDGFFWAGMAGGRQNRIDKLNANLDEWQAYAAQLEDLVEQLRHARLFWFNTAVNEGGQTRTLLQGFEEITGKSMRQHVGDANMDSRLKQHTEEQRKAFLKDWDPKL